MIKCCEIIPAMQWHIMERDLGAEVKYADYSINGEKYTGLLSNEHPGFLFLMKEPLEKNIFRSIGDHGST